MRGIDLYKAILDGETKYDGKKFEYKSGDNKEEVRIINNHIFHKGYCVLTKGSIIINELMKAELTEIATPIPWQECIQKWAESYGKYTIKVVNQGVEAFYNNGSFLKDDTGFGIENNEILKGEWYLIKR